MKLLSSTIAVATLATCQGFSTTLSASTRAPISLHMASDGDITRREALQTTLASTLIVLSSSTPANAISQCPPGSNNCVRQTWTPPSSTAAADAASQLRDALNAYPQEGQEDGKVDGGGYKVISDDLGSRGAIQLEYRSSGKGTFAKIFNGGKPFVDDVVIEPNGTNFEVRSSSRVGDSDFGVNGKRLSYIGGVLKGKGWTGM
jgi:hypothetical protein